MGFWVSSSYNDLLYPIPTFDLKGGMRAMLANPQIQDAGQMWQSDYGEVQNLAAWRNSYVLTVNPDGSYLAVEKFPGGAAFLPLTLTPITGSFRAETFEAYGDATTTIPAWPEKAQILPPTYTDGYGTEQTRNPVGRGAGESQVWENPDDWVIITGTCTQMAQTCEDPPTEIQWAASAHETTQRGYVKGGKPQEEYMKCYRCDGTWTETTQIVDMENVPYWIWNEEPVRMPKGWRVDSTGHLTNLPLDLNVIDRADAISKGVGVISTYDGPSFMGRKKWKYQSPCVYFTNASAYQYSQADCESMDAGGGGGHIEYLKWAISELKDYANKVGIQPVWWLEGPTFTATCGDSTDTNYNPNAYYIDNTLCSKTKNGGAGGAGGNGDSEGSTSWGPIIAAGAVIGLATWGATIYGGGI